MTCFETSLTKYVNDAVSLPMDTRLQIGNFIRTEVGNLKTNMATIWASLSTQPDSFFSNLVSVSPTSLSAYIDTARNVLNRANSYQNGLCSSEVKQFQTMVTSYDLTSDASLLRCSCLSNFIVLAILSTIFYF
ncbi:hypothetical protein Ciccas_006569 [Cichlidogyrus casuarinus]|uniref:Uncharacterized protein n=1 Tax=Cichlidogyrus casuarinus TaxID=1844966 RepID=A0ABD2Q5G2_9PLAT